MAARKPTAKTTAATKTPKVEQKEKETTNKIELKTVYTFMFGRNIYTVKMDDIKKVTLLGHNILEKKDDIEEVKKTLFIFSVSGNQIPGAFEEDENGTKKPMYETIMEVKAEENEYSNLYDIYEDIVIKWDKYQFMKTNSVNNTVNS